MKIATSIHHGSILANAGSKPNELSGLGCKDVGAEPDLLSYDAGKSGLNPHLNVVVN